MTMQKGLKATQISTLSVTAANRLDYQPTLRNAARLSRPEMALRGKKGVFCGSITKREVMQGSYLRVCPCNITSTKKQILNQLNGN